jgi:hypothetical protein
MMTMVNPKKAKEKSKIKIKKDFLMIQRSPKTMTVISQRRVRRQDSKTQMRNRMKMKPAKNHTTTTK